MEWRLFADLAERTGERTVGVDVADDASVREALDALLEVHPDLRERVVEDGGVVDHVTVLADGTALTADDLDRSLETTDELALCPPVSGG
jgi:molybdopterin synthase sulfur carrier subunit